MLIINTFLLIHNAQLADSFMSNQCLANMAYFALLGILTNHLTSDHHLKEISGNQLK